MMPSRLYSLCVAVSLLAAALDVQATPASVSLSATAVYDLSADCTSGSARAPVIVTAVQNNNCAASIACVVSNGQYPSTICSTTIADGSGDYGNTDLPNLFTANAPYVYVVDYAAGTSCATEANVQKITSYLADGTCHKTGASTSFIAVRRASDGTAAVKKFSTPDCTGVSTTLVVTAAQSTGNSCAADGNGIVDTKVYGRGTTDVFLSSAATFVDTANTCTLAASTKLTQLVTSVVATACASDSGCASGSTAEPYTSTQCNKWADYATKVGVVLPTTPYVIVEKYASGSKCALTDLQSITTYVADGKCHKTGASTSFIAVRRASDGTTAVKTFSAAPDCTGVSTTLVVTAAQYTGNSCAADGNGIADTKVFGSGTTDVFLSSAATFVDTANTCTLAASTKLTQLVTSVVATACASDSGCASGSTAEPYTSTQCNKWADYATKVGVVLPTTPYVIVEKYASGSKCALTDLQSITTYVADGKCHKTGASTSFIAVRRASDGTTAVKTFSAAPDCTGVSTTLVVTAAQYTGNSCAADGNGIADTKVFGSGTTDVFLSSAATFVDTANTCTLAASTKLTQLVTSVVATACASDSGCASGSTAEPYTSTQCNKWADYATKVGVVLPTTPYVIVEKYASGSKCALTDLQSITTYVADGTCHKTGASTSFIAVRRASDGTTAVKTFSAAPDCTGVSTTLVVTAAQYTGNSCAADGNGIADTKVFGSGTTDVFLSSAATFVDTANTCTLAASTKLTQLVTSVVATACASDSGCASGSTAEPYTSTQCNKWADYATKVGVVLPTTPYVIVEKYASGSKCALTDLQSITTYVADGTCHKTGASTSFIAVRRASDGTTAVKTFSAAPDCTGVSTTLVVTAAQYTGNSCAADGNGIADTKVFGSGTTSLALSSTATFVDAVKTCKLVVGSTLTQLVSAPTTTACTADTTCATGQVAEPYTSAQCGTSINIASTVATVFGASTPYLIVERYTAGANCALTDLQTITTYVADGKCHKTGTSTSFIAVRKADGTSAIKTFTAGADCTGVSTTLMVTAAQFAGNSCASDANGFVDTKLYGSANVATAFTLSSAATFSDAVKTCKLVVGSTLTQLISTPTTTACTADTTCGTGSTAEPYTSAQCGTSFGIANTVATVFGASTPYVIVEKYTVGAKCALTDLQSITTYVADGKCHKTGTSTSFIAVRKADGTSAIKTFTAGADCTGASTTLMVTAAQFAGNSCAADANGILATKIYGNGITALALSSAATFADAVKTCTLVTGSTLTQLVAIPATTTCTPDAVCGTGQTAEPYSSTQCSTTIDYSTKVATVFGASTPYVIVEKYATGAMCALTDLQSITTYVADGKCHKTGTSTSFIAVRKADGKAAIKTFTAAADCTGVSTTFMITASQSTGNSCASDANGIVDTKVYGSGATPLALSSTATFSDAVKTCTLVAGSALTQLVTTRAATTCTPSTTCGTGQTAEPYSSTQCGTITDYKNTVSTVFGASTPYVTVEKYATGAKCALTDLQSITTYVADGKCHKTGTSTSFIAVRKADGTAAIKMFAAAADCTGVSTTFMITASQSTGNSCASDANGIVDTKVYGSGATPLALSSTATFSDAVKTCTLVAGSALTQLVTTRAATTCTPSTTCGTGQTAEPYTSTQCGTTADYANTVSTVFGASTPYVTVEKYATGAKCALTDLQSITTYVADGKCHKSSASTSFIAMWTADGKATVNTFTATGDCSGASTSLVVTAAQYTGNTCTAGADGIADTRIYGNGKAVFSAVLLFEDTSCAEPSQVIMTSGTACTTSTCAASGARSLATICSGDIFNVASSVFSTAQYLVVEIYKAGSSCGVFQGVAVYLADAACHVAMDGHSYKVTFDDGSATLDLFTDGTCADTNSDKTRVPVSPDQLSGNSCLDDNVYYAFNAPARTPTVAPTTAPTTTAPSPTTTASTGSGKSAAVSLVPTSIMSLVFFIGIVAALLH